MTDPRAGAYIAEHGDQSWEVDALPPNELARIIRAAFSEVIDRKAMDAVIAQEKVDKKDLERAVRKLRPA